MTQRLAEPLDPGDVILGRMPRLLCRQLNSLTGTFNVTAPSGEEVRNGENGQEECHREPEKAWQEVCNAVGRYHTEGDAHTFKTRCSAYLGLQIESMISSLHINNKNSVPPYPPSI